VPIINIGNLSVGGTGKTPHTEYLIRLLQNDYQLFTLSRGYGRKEPGFKIADESSTARQVGDEPLSYYRKYGDTIGVAVDANRVMGVIGICRENPKTEVILLDDAYQHRAIQAGLNILITTFDRPFFKDFILPVGDLREFRSGKDRADIIIVSKCPELNEQEKSEIIEKIRPNKHQQVFFSRIRYGEMRALNALQKGGMEATQPVILVTAIAQAKYLKKHLEKKHPILHHFEFNDHYDFKVSDITKVHNLFDKFVSENPIIVTTEKDAMRLEKSTLSEHVKAYPWLVQTIEIEIDKEGEFNKLVKKYVEENS
jgi:tetraacyldisaccharide 4'-kinase